MLNALRHHCAGHLCAAGALDVLTVVLNALRHHCAGHASPEVSVRDLAGLC